MCHDEKGGQPDQRGVPPNTDIVRGFGGRHVQIGQLRRLARQSRVVGEVGIGLVRWGAGRRRKAGSRSAVKCRVRWCRLKSAP
jgi:hypothetical protein